MWWRTVVSVKRKVDQLSRRAECQCCEPPLRRMRGLAATRQDGNGKDDMRELEPTQARSEMREEVGTMWSDDQGVGRSSY